MEKPRSSSEKSDKDPERERQKRAEKILRLVEKINESGESLPFSGIHPEAYSRMKKDEDEFPGYTTPIDEIIQMCVEEGIKIVLGKYPESGNVFVLPVGSTDIKMDSIAPYQLIIDTVENEHLKELIRFTTREK